MDKEYIVKNKVYFRIENSEESEYIQNYLFDLGFVWLDRLYDNFGSRFFSSHKKILSFSTNYNKNFNYYITTNIGYTNNYLLLFIKQRQIHTGFIITCTKLMRNQKLEFLKLNG